MRRMLQTLILVGLAITACAAEPNRPKHKLRNDAPAGVREAFEKSERMKDELLANERKVTADAAAHLRAIERAKVDRNGSNGSNGKKDSRGNWIYIFHTIEQRREAAERQKQAGDRLRVTIQKVKTDPAVTFYEQGTSEDLKTGYIGRFGYAKVTQVIDDMTCIAALSVFSNKDDGDLYRSETVDVFLEGMPTAGFTDGVEIQLQDKPFLVKGTKAYTTVLGAKRTILQLVAFNMKDFAAE